MTQNGAGETESGRRVLLGHIVGAHGIKGAVLVRSYTAEPEAIADYGALEAEDGVTHLDLTIEGATSKGLICRVAGVADRNAAERLKGTGLYVARTKLPEPDEGEFYHTDLIGLSVITEDGGRLGRVANVLNYGAGDILEVSAGDATRTVLYPMTESVVRRVDLAQGVIVIAPPEELDAGDQGADTEGDGE